ncbi:Hsp33 family molecular chaperone HslO [Marinimicrobium agarilyticum]|uniref:Hsp33 family molecular chaperone HslO n=1 Tax=Marinimicrobium agarilyticum TaxID=306546 RepID=UPI00041494AF|nr:Hsp33 family molecular chaperone HslO [Marinimicrobium agarilyticum]
MPDNDLLHRFLFDECDIRGEVVSLGDSYREVMNNNPYPAGVRELLGECLTAAALLSKHPQVQRYDQPAGPGRRSGQHGDGRV